MASPSHNLACRVCGRQARPVLRCNRGQIAHLCGERHVTWGFEVKLEKRGGMVDLNRVFWSFGQELVDERKRAKERARRNFMGRGS